MRRRLPWWVLALVFVALPLVEVYLLVQLGQVVGAAWTIALLFLTGVLGSVLIRREGGRAWRALNDVLRAGRMPARELADGALILVGGALLLTPGFLTDGVGLFLILPFSRPLARGVLTRIVARRLAQAGPAGPGPAGPWGRSSPRRPGTPDGPDQDVVRGEVVDE